MIVRPCPASNTERTRMEVNEDWELAVMIYWFVQTEVEAMDFVKLQVFPDDSAVVTHVTGVGWNRGSDEGAIAEDMKNSEVEDDMGCSRGHSGR